MNPNSFTLKDTKSLLHCKASSIATEHAVTVKEKCKGGWNGRWRREGSGEVAALGGGTVVVRNEDGSGASGDGGDGGRGSRCRILG